jgi:hypothetical protein
MRELGQAGPNPVVRLARMPPFGPPERARHGVSDEALIQGVVIAHRGGLVGEQAAANLLKRTGRFAEWLETYTPERGRRPDPVRATWMFAAVTLAESAMRRKSIEYRRPSPAGLAGVWLVFTGSAECARRLYRRYQTLQALRKKFEDWLRHQG